LLERVALIASGLVGAIPDLLAVVLILILAVVLIRLSNAWFRQVRLGRLRIPGFYAEWALPTSRIVAFVVALIALSTAFPLIPGSDNKVFQGAGLAIGALAAIGSGVVTSNLLSGLMLFYTRAFRTGDRVEINGVVGVVQERSLVTTRLQTARNELVSIPNTTVLGSSVVNYSFARREVRQPVALSATISIGYNVPWRQVHALMLEAARGVSGISNEIAPFVLQTSLNDFHISYEVTAYLRDARTYRQTLSDLLAALQDRFAEAGVEIMSPGQLQVRRG
jgi:small-conductance mechanosensitive channel